MALTISRRRDESVYIGDSISILVTETRAGRTMLSIDAPRSLKILRGENRTEPIQRNVSASEVAVADVLFNAEARDRLPPHLLKALTEALAEDRDMPAPILDQMARGAAERKRGAVIV